MREVSKLWESQIGMDRAGQIGVPETVDNLHQSMDSGTCWTYNADVSPSGRALIQDCTQFHSL